MDLDELMNEAAEWASRNSGEKWRRNGKKSLILPLELRKGRRIYALIADGPLKGFDNLWFEYDDETFPGRVILADNAIWRRDDEIRLIRLDELQTLNSEVDIAKRDFVKDLEKKKPRCLLKYDLIDVTREEGRPVYSYRGIHRMGAEDRRRAEKPIEIES